MGVDLVGVDLVGVDLVGVNLVGRPSGRTSLSGGGSSESQEPNHANE